RQAFPSSVHAAAPIESRSSDAGRRGGKPGRGLREGERASVALSNPELPTRSANSTASNRLRFHAGLAAIPAERLSGVNRLRVMKVLRNAQTQVRDSVSSA